MARTVTCLTRGGYSPALTRGRTCEVLAEDPERTQLKVRGDNGRARWFPASYFDRTGKPAVTLLSWKFDIPVEDPLDDAAEISCEFSDGSRRWCLAMTPRFLIRQLTAEEPGIHESHLLVMRSLDAGDVEKALRLLDQQGELPGATLPLNIE